MLKLTDAQLQQLEHLEQLQYVEEVRKNIVAESPDMAADRALSMRLEQAYRHAVGLGFTEGADITQFLYYEAFAPGFYRQTSINTWLTKPGQRVEQRFADLIAQMKSKLKEY